MKPPSTDEYRSPREAGRTAIDYVRDAFIGGLAVVVPFVITVVVLATIVQYIVRYLRTVIGAAPGQEPSPAMLGLAVALLVVLVLLVGFVTQFRYGEAFIEHVDAVLARIPGFGSIYESFREMSDVMMESDEQSFRDVKLVEFPHEGAYTLGFLTAESAPELKDATGRDDLVTLFLPLAPNPVMGGHLVHVPSGHVMDVDMTVDQGIRTVVTSGVATGGPQGAGEAESLSAAELERIAASSETAVGSNATRDYDVAERQRRGADESTRAGAYEESLTPDSADEEPVPSGVESYGDDGALGDDHRTPDAVESDDADTLGGDKTTPTDVAAEHCDSSLGTDSETPADVREDDPPKGRWRDRTQDDDAGDGREETGGLTDEDVDSDST